jgi:thiamine kinase-like enzyme
VNYFQILVIALLCNFCYCLSSLTAENYIEQILVEGLPNENIEDLTVKILKGGLSGAGLYKIDSPKKSYVLRLHSPSDVNSQYDNELFALIEASKRGLSPEVYYVSPDKQAVLMEFIGLPTITLEQAKSSENIVKMANAIRLAHQIEGYPTNGEDLYSKAIRCHQIVLEDKLATKAEIDHALELIKENLKKFESFNYSKVYLHGDLNPRNIFITPERVLLIDWAETSFDDPFSDLTYFALKLDYDGMQEGLLMESYLQRKPTAEEFARFRLNKVIHQAFWSLTNLYLANAELKKSPEQTIDKFVELKDWGYYQKQSADGTDLSAQYFYELSRLNYMIACTNVACCVSQQASETAFMHN